MGVSLTSKNQWVVGMELSSGKTTSNFQRARTWGNCKSTGDVYLLFIICYLFNIFFERKGTAVSSK